jgi:hypothetical protein
VNAGLLEAKPLAEEIARRDLLDLSLRMADRFNKDTKVCRRTLERLVAGQKWVSIRVADEVCLALGIHPEHLWPGAA